MSIVFQQILILLLFVILQRSFFDILWPGFNAPAMIITTTIVLVFVLGFTRALGWVLLLILFYELLGNDSRWSTFSVMAIGIAYATSFLSRRLLIERHVESSLVLGLVSACMTLMYLLFLALWQDVSISIPAVTGNMLLAFLLFPIVFTIFRVREERIRLSLMSEFRGIRT